MNFQTHLDNQIEHIPKFIARDAYQDFQHEHNYHYEIFALRHFVDHNTELKSVDSSVENMQDCLSYIEQRALNTVNPVLRARYNDLLWTYRTIASKIVKKGNVAQKCKLAIDNYVAILQEKILNRKDNTDIGSNLRKYLFRAWKMAKQVRSKLHQQEIAEIMINIENSIDDDCSIGIWGFSYDKLIKDTSINLTLDQEQRIIDKLAERVNRLDATHYNALEYGVKKLLEYYHKKDKSKLLKYFQILDKNAHVPSEIPFHNQMRYERFIELCNKYQMNELKEKAIVQYQYFGKESREKMIRIEQKTAITPEMRDKLVDAFYHKDKIIHLLKITENFILNKERIKGIHQNNESEFKLGKFFSTSIVNEDGIPLKTLKDETDDELFSICYITWQAQYSYLAITLDDFQSKHEIYANEWFKLLYSELIYEENKVTLQAAIQAFIKKDYIVMIHVVIPLIENSLRKLLFICNHSIYEQNRYDGFENITLTRILATLENYLNEDIIFHLKFVLSEKAGLNLRNRLSHGLVKDSGFNELNALTLLHVLMVLKYLVGFGNQVK